MFYVKYSYCINNFGVMIQLIYSAGIEKILIDGVETSYDLNSDVDMGLIRLDLSESFMSIIEQSEADVAWLTRTFERNTLHSKLFEDICFVVMVAKLYETYPDSDVKIFSSRYSFWPYFGKTAKFSLRDRFCFSCRWAFERVKDKVRNICFFSSCVKRLLLNHRGIKQLESNTYVIQTWVNDSNVLDGCYQERYFDGLVEYLQGKGLKVKVWAMIYASTSYSTLVRSLNNLISPVYLYDFVKFGDLFSVVKLMRKKRHLAKGIRSVLVGGVDVSSLVCEYIGRECYEEADL
ncbi:MAG: hypothetical protein ACI86C_001497, partial [Candidatus Latescibacterota bacterium]